MENYQDRYSLKEEIWKPIKDYENKYLISNHGRVKSLKSNKILTTKYTGNYPHIVLFKNNVRKNFTIHYLVATAFVENPHDFKEVNHIDENPMNNFPSNLEWCTHKYNVNYGTRNKRTKEKLSIGINQYDLDGKYIRTWNCMNDAIRFYNNNRHICEVCKGKRKTASGFIWKYKEQ